MSRIVLSMAARGILKFRTPLRFSLLGWACTPATKRADQVGCRATPLGRAEAARFQLAAKRNADRGVASMGSLSQKPAERAGSQVPAREV